MAISIRYVNSRAFGNGRPDSPASLNQTNILVDEMGVAQICDLGYSHFSADFLRSRSDRVGGHSRYLAPELSDPNDDSEIVSTQSSDVFSLAMTIYELMTGDWPFSEIHGDRSVMGAISSGRRPLKPVSLAGLDKSAADAIWKLIETMWSGDPQQRPTCREVAEGLDLIVAALPSSSNKPLPLSLLYPADSGQITSLSASGLASPPTTKPHFLLPKSIPPVKGLDDGYSSRFPSSVTRSHPDVRSGVAPPSYSVGDPSPSLPRMTRWWRRLLRIFVAPQ